MFITLLVFCGVNVAVEDLPAWMAATAEWLPLTHGIAAAREVADGAALSTVGDLLAREAGLGAAYTVLGLCLLRFFEWESRAAPPSSGSDALTIRACRTRSLGCSGCLGEGRPVIHGDP